MSLVLPVLEKIHMAPTAVVNLFFILSHVTGQPAVGNLPESSQGATTAATESIVTTTSTTAPVVHVTEAFEPGPEEEMIHPLHDDLTDDVIMLKESEKTGDRVTLKEMVQK